MVWGQGLPEKGGFYPFSSKKKNNNNNNNNRLRWLLVRKCKRTFSANAVEHKRTLRFNTRTRFNIEPTTNNPLFFHEYSNIQSMGKRLSFSPNSWKIIIFFHKFSLLILKYFQVKKMLPRAIITWDTVDISRPRHRCFSRQMASEKGAQNSILTTRHYNTTQVIAWENSRHLATPPLVSPLNDVWETSAKIPYWWRVTTQIWVVLLISWIKFSHAARPILSTTQLWRVTRLRYGISALVSQTSFGGGGGEPVVASRNVGHFFFFSVYLISKIIWYSTWVCGFAWFGQTGKKYLAKK